MEEEEEPEAEAPPAEDAKAEGMHKNHSILTKPK